MTFKSTVVTIPGLTGSGPNHWQSCWEKRYGFKRISQKNWDTPVCEEWINTIEKETMHLDLANTLFVGHSLGCTAIVMWAKKYNKRLKGAMLVAASDNEAADFPKTTTGFVPMPLFKLPFPSILVMSSNDDYLSVERAHYFGNNWSSEVIDIGNAGHINTASGYGEWKEGLVILKKLDN
ncbi:MAG: alpha/beta hydrolase [Bacteroidia bacterium]